MKTKDEAAKELMEWHASDDPEIMESYRFFSGNEDDPDEPIRILEVSNATFETGRFDAIPYAPSKRFPYFMRIAVASQDEMCRIKSGDISLPDDWNLETAVRYSPSRVAHAA